MKGYLIDSNKRIITEIKAEGLEDYYKLIGCRVVEYVEIRPGLDIIVDEEGMFNSNDFFTYGDSFPIAGNGIVAGVNHKDGETIDAPVTLEEVKSNVEFLTRLEAARLADELDI